jgi:hypothetical protein
MKKGFYKIIIYLFVMTFFIVSTMVASSHAEFQVNTFTPGNETNPCVAMDTSGNFVIVWERGDGDGEGIYGQRYDSAGNPMGSEFQVNTHTEQDQQWPSVAMDASGNFIIAWTSDGQDGDGYGIYAQRYNSAGNTVGSEFRVNTYTENWQWGPSVAIDANGNFIIAWQSYWQDSSYQGIYAQRYNSAGNTVGSEFRVNTYTANDQTNPSVAIDANGNFIIAWQSNVQDGSGYGIYAQRYDSAGNTVGSEFRVNTYTTNDQTNPSVSMDASGNFVIAWISEGRDGDGNGIYAQRYDGTGNPVGSEFQVNTYTANNQGLPYIAMNGGGKFVVAWQSDGQDGDGYGIYAQRYNKAGKPMGPEFQVNVSTTNDQTNPSVAMDASGNFIIAWQSDGQDEDGYGIYAHRYDSLGNPVGSEFQVNTYSLRSMAMNANGNFVIVWQAIKCDGVIIPNCRDYIYAQRYDSAGNPVGSEFQVNNNTTNDQINPSVAIDANGNFVIAWNSYFASTNPYGIYGNIYAVSCSSYGCSSSKDVASTSDYQTNPSVAMDVSGNFVIVWSKKISTWNPFVYHYDVYARQYDSLGNSVGSEFQVNTDSGQATVAMDASGNFVIAWTSAGQDGDGYVVYAQRYDDTGNLIESEFQVNTSTPNAESSSVAMDASGNFVIAWTSDRQDGDGYGIYAQRFDKLGNRAGSEFQVNTYTTNNQQSPSVAMDASNNFVIAWTSDGQDGDGYGIYARRFNYCTGSQENTCNGIDDDCDGLVDEDYLQTQTTCGLGVCASTGQLICVNGSLQDTCMVGPQEGNDDNCNGIDENCNGTADENYVPVATTCGIGECGATGQLICSADNIVNTCTPGLPQQEICNGLDDDCDGVVPSNEADTDGDGIWDCNDNCPNISNPDQLDSDGDGIGNACQAVKGDLDGDGDVDQNDVSILLSFRNKPASQCTACDLDGDGTITALDSRKLILLCTRPRCATQ